MSVGVLPHVVDTRSIDEVYADRAAQARRQAFERSAPQMDTVSRLLAASVPGWSQLSDERRREVAFSIVEAVDAGF